MPLHANPITTVPGPFTPLTAQLAQALFIEDGGAGFRPDFEPEEAAALAAASASFRCVPDLLWAKQAFMQVG